MIQEMQWSLTTTTTTENVVSLVLLLLKPITKATETGWAPMRIITGAAPSWLASTVENRGGEHCCWALILGHILHGEWRIGAKQSLSWLLLTMIDEKWEWGEWEWMLVRPHHCSTHSSTTVIFHGYSPSNHNLGATIWLVPQHTVLMIVMATTTTDMGYGCSLQLFRLEETATSN